MDFLNKPWTETENVFWTGKVPSFLASFLRTKENTIIEFVYRSTRCTVFESILLRKKSKRYHHTFHVRSHCHQRSTCHEWELDASGYLRCGNDNDLYISGDLGYFDEYRRLYLGGRVQDTIRTGGETVLAIEVERAVASHPSIVECAVFPLHHDKYGEAVACALVQCNSKKQVPVDLVALKWLCRRQGLVGYKHPTVLFHVESLPRNSSGKVVKYKLFELFGTTLKVPSLQSKL
jgi:acyl-CoA synthetase (AMP-forming)/AMP-acid ligase II